MPIRHRIIPQFSLVVSVGHGVLRAEDLQRHRSDVRADPAYVPSLAQLMDLRRVRDFIIEARELRTHALDERFDRPYFARVAVIADTDLAFGLAGSTKLTPAATTARSASRCFATKPWRGGG